MGYVPPPPPPRYAEAVRAALEALEDIRNLHDSCIEVTSFSDPERQFLCAADPSRPLLIYGDPRDLRNSLTEDDPYGVPDVPGVATGRTQRLELRCKACNEALPLDSTFCVYCGTKV